MIEAIKFLRLAWDAYRKAKISGRPYYAAVTSHGVPEVCVFVGIGREAWWITQQAIERFRYREEHPMKKWRIRTGYIGSLAPGESITIGQLEEEPMGEKEKLTDAQLDKISAELDKSEQALALPNKQIGETIVLEAKTAHDEELRKKVINEVKRLMQCSDESKAAIELYTKSLAWYEKKLKAIQAGEFEFTLKGEIFPHDEDLRRANY